ncbi:sigma-70 family RNA polymerase sigma factor [Bacillus sp. OAE603]|uniref:sigma-70 family RNA polymerase sigma factor n=1 Tax=Gottfriedia sp. OAE603 TaxID=2663872 RepID=UPI00178A9945
MINKKDSHFSYQYDFNTNEFDKDWFINNLIDTYSQKVYLIAFSYVKDKGVAEDISQEVFLKCYKSLENFRGDASIKTWIYRITVNTAKDYLKKNSSMLLNFPNLFFESRRKGESTEDIYLKNSQNEYLIQIVHSLPVKYREVIILHYFHELKIEEMGDALDTNINTVKTRLARGRSMLRKKLDSKKGEMPNV